MRLVLLLLLAVPLFGQSEICRFPAGDPVDPFRRWLSSQELTCVAATPRTEIPAGSWNVFARSSTELSAPIFVQGPTSVDATTLQNGPAATLNVQLPEGHNAVVYVPRRSIAFPVTGARTSIPAGEQLWLFVLEKRTIASIVPISAIDAGTERAVDARTGGLAPSLLTWLRAAEEDRKPLRNASGVTSPRVRMTAGGATREADSLPAPAFLDGAFVLVRGVSAGAAELEIAGSGWLAHRASVTVAPRNVTAVTAPLLVRPAASLLVSFSTGEDVVALDRSLGSCDPSKDKPSLFEITVFSCPEPPPGGEIDPNSCKLIRQETFGAEVPYGTFTVDDVAPGNYRAVMHFGKLPPVATMVTVQALQQRPVRLSATYMSVYGSLTHGGEPLDDDANIIFPGGGIGFGSKETGEYHAVLLDHIIEPDAILHVATCRNELRAPVVTDEFVKPFTRFDIDIPNNSITVNVTDTFTQMTLREAKLRYVVRSKRGYQVLITRDVPPVDEMSGRFVIKAVPERRIELTVTHAGYQRYAVVPFTMSKSEHKTIDVQLVPLRGTRGRIVSPVPFDEGTVTWHSPSGRGGETVELGPDGTFFYEHTHEPGEIMTVVSRSHPLWIWRMPAVASRETLQVRYPDAPARTFDVRIEGADERAMTPIGMSIGDLPVPAGALFQHQRLRDSHISIRGNRSAAFRDILETGPIEVFAGSPDSPRKRLMPGITEVVVTPGSGGASK